MQQKANAKLLMLVIAPFDIDSNNVHVTEMNVLLLLGILERLLQKAKGLPEIIKIGKFFL